MSRRLIAVLIAASLLAACGPAGLTDAQTVWCKANVEAVAASATSLGLAAPADNAKWSDWAVAIEAAQGLTGVQVDNPWDTLTVASDRPNRDRACVAAYQSR